ncbi:MAG: GNAT family N-acetyltransferase [Chloroflexi bacterium]|nr:GNAT family N-acetyltransferase [Chloroflexota bacterium]
MDTTFTGLETAIAIRRASWRDLAAVKELEAACFPQDAWPLLEVIAVLTLPGVVRLKAVERGEVIGFVAGEVRRGEATAWIATICVHPGQRGRGIGRALLAECERRMKLPRVRLTVRASNTAAIEMYQRAGYTEVGRWPRYYRGGEDGLVMEKSNGR